MVLVAIAILISAFHESKPLSETGFFGGLFFLMCFLDTFNEST